MTTPPCPKADDDLALRAVMGVAQTRPDNRRAERAFLQATQDLTLCGAAAWERMRQGGTSAEKLHVELQHTRFLLREAREHTEILAARLERMGPRRRPHYSPPLRFRILEHRKKYLLTVEETARRFLVTPQTIYNWIDEMRREPEATTVGSKIRPGPASETLRPGRPQTRPADEGGGLRREEEDRRDPPPELVDRLPSDRRTHPEGEAAATASRARGADGHGRPPSAEITRTTSGSRTSPRSRRCSPSSRST